MKEAEKSMNYLKDFKELNYSTPEMFLEFEIGKEKTKVKSTYKVERLSDSKEELFFDGEKLKFLSLAINGEKLSAEDYEVQEEGLRIKNFPDAKNFTVTFENEIYPAQNTDLEGLYVSGDMLCTQNEPMGFRRITYSIDRPDNMVKCRVKICGDKKEFPYMLSNGNLVAEGTENSMDFCEWEDPFPKPLYLFALVAGDLAELTDSYTTKSGKTVDIKFYCDKGAEDKCDFAIESLKKSMKWDEERFNLEYDLDLYMVVAVDSFNMGAMENKGLNIFNSALVLAKPSTATDVNYHRIESVIGHEYFHNWTGNRVTLKNWYQLTLKEGLTVFRDQEFSADLNDRAVERIDMVQSLKSRQFPEDASPLAHPIRPEQYKEMNNFYTATVYEKGAEIIRMIHTILGEDKFQKAMADYFAKYDGTAITTEDFLNTMAAQEPLFDKESFETWYHSPGTPHVVISESYQSGELTLHLKQSNEKAKEKKLGSEVTYIPIKLSLYDSKGEKIKLNSLDQKQKFLDKGVLVLSEAETEITFTGVPEDYVVSYFENFSAPVTYEVKSATRNLSTLIKYDQDHFNKYYAIKESALNFAEEREGTHLEDLKHVFKDQTISFLMKAKLFSSLSFSDLIEGKSSFDPHKVNERKSAYLKKVGDYLGEEMLAFIKENPLKKYTYNLEEKGHRAFFLTVADYLFASEKYSKDFVLEADKIYFDSDNMTIQVGLYSLFNAYSEEESKKLTQDFFEKSKDNGLTLQKWITGYLQNPSIETISQRIAEVQKLEGYSDKVPNFVRSLWGGFVSNTDAFHAEGGKGYTLLLDAIAKIDGINPQMASALMKQFSFAPRVDGINKEPLRKALVSFGESHSKISSHLSETYESIKGAL